MLFQAIAFRHVGRNNNRLNSSTSTLGMWPFSKPDPTGVEIIDAVLNKDVSKIESILKQGSSALNKRDNQGRNALHLISKLGHYKYPPTEIPKKLIENGIDLNAKDGFGQTALEISLLSGWQKLAMLYLDNGADRSVVTSDVVQRITCPDCKRVVREYKL